MPTSSSPFAPPPAPGTRVEWQPDRLPPIPIDAQAHPRWVIAAVGAGLGAVLLLSGALPWVRYGTDIGTVTQQGREIAGDDSRLLVWFGLAIAVSFLLTLLTKSATWLVIAILGSLGSLAIGLANLANILRQTGPYSNGPSDPGVGAGVVVVIAAGALALLTAFYAGAEYRRLARRRKAAVAA